MDAVICTLGTTIKLAGSQSAFAAVDRDLPIQIAKLARQVGATRFALNSALGASPGGNFYQCTKFETEAGIRALGYPRYTIVRPSLIDAERSQPRPAEHFGVLLARALRPLIPLALPGGQGGVDRISIARERVAGRSGRVRLAVRMYYYDAGSNNTRWVDGLKQHVNPHRASEILGVDHFF